MRPEAACEVDSTLYGIGVFVAPDPANNTAGGDEFEVRVVQRKLDVLKWGKHSSVFFLLLASG